MQGYLQLSFRKRAALNTESVDENKKRSDHRHGTAHRDRAWGNLHWAEMLPTENKGCAPGHGPYGSMSGQKSHGEADFGPYIKKINGDGLEPAITATSHLESPVFEV